MNNYNLSISELQNDPVSADVSAAWDSTNSNCAVTDAEYEFTNTFTIPAGHSQIVVAIDVTTYASAGDTFKAQFNNLNE